MLRYGVGVGVATASCASVGAVLLRCLRGGVQKDERRMRISFVIGDCGAGVGVGGAFVRVGLVLLHVVGGINVASAWGCVQGVWMQCRCWSL